MELIPSQHVKNCQKCSLCKNRSKIVPSYLPKRAKVLFVAQAPGRSEDIEGTMPLIGPAGQALNECLDLAGLSRDDPNYAFSNSVRCYPPQDRPPKAIEIKACSEYLDTEIELLKPDYIVCLGNVALKRITGKIGITSFRKQWIKSDRYNCYVLGTLHPSTALSNKDLTGDNQRTIISDFRWMGKIFKGGITPPKQVEYTVITNISQAKELFEKLNTVQRWAVDIETTSTDPKEGRILCIGFSWESYRGVTLPLYTHGLTKAGRRAFPKVKNNIAILDPKEIISWEDSDEPMHVWLKSYWSKEDTDWIWKELKKVLENKVAKITQNGKFEYTFLHHKGIEVNNLKYDTMLMHHRLDEESRKHDLGTLAILYTDVGRYWEVLDPYLPRRKKKTYACIPPKILWWYNSMDCDVTFRVWKALWGRVKKEKLDEVLKQIDMPAVKLLGKMEYEGVRVNIPHMRNLSIKYQKILLGMSEKLHKFSYIKRAEEILTEKLIERLTTRYDKLADRTKERESLQEYLERRRKPVKFNLNSNDQQRILFFNAMKLDPIAGHKSKITGEPSIDVYFFETYGKKNRFMRSYGEYRRVFHLDSSYITGVLPKIGSDGRMHTNFNMHRTKTFRLSSSEPINMQQIPNKDNNPKEYKEIRDMFLPDENEVFIEGDFKQAEFRWLGHYSNDYKLIQDINSGVDIHRLMASLTYKIPITEVTDQQRSFAKTVTFGIMFGRSAKAIAKEFEVSVEEAETVRQVFYKRYPIAKKELDRWIIDTKKTKTIRNAFGRIRHLRGVIDSKDEKLASHGEREAINFPIQSASSDMHLIAALKMVKRFKEENIPAKLRILIHDAILLSVQKKYVKPTVRIMDDVMRNVHPIIKVKMQGEFEVGESWGQMMEYSL